MLFGTTTSCILTPDNANGPYFVLGEQICSNVVESQVGVPLHLEMQFVRREDLQASHELDGRYLVL